MKTSKKIRRKFRRRGQFHVYIVRCADGTYYTGSTGNLRRRIESHNKGRGAKYLRGKRPVELVYARPYRYYKLVVTAERKIKQFTRRQKEKLMNASAAGRGPLKAFSDDAHLSRHLP